METHDWDKELNDYINNNALIKYTPMITKIAYALNPALAEDLIIVGKMTLLDALWSFDRKKKTKLSSYLYMKVLYAMKDELRKIGDKKGIKFIPLYECEVESVVDTEELILSREKTTKLKELMTKLKPRERKIIELIYWNGMTLMEVACHIQLKEARVAQIHKDILAKLRSMMNEG